MDILRYGHDAWGQVVVNGLSWGLLPVAVGAGAAVIVVHLVIRAFTRSPGRQPGSASGRAAGSSSGPMQGGN
jgi:hypothetical protein